MTLSHVADAIVQPDERHPSAHVIGMVGPGRGEQAPARVLDDALEILILIAAENDPRFDRAAARWIGRLLAETPISLADARYTIALVERLPQCSETLRRLARRR